MPKNKSNEVRQDFIVVIRRVTPPKQNVSKNETMDLKNLKTNNKIMIMKEDKGNTTIVMDTCDHLAKMEEHLALGGSYKNLTKDPSTRIIKEVKKAIDDSMLNEEQKRR